MPWLRPHRPSRKRREAPLADFLEPRLLYSADAAGALGFTLDAAAPTEQRSLDADFNYAVSAATTISADQVRAAYALTPMQFEANAGQLGDGVDFAAHGVGYSVRLGDGQAELLLDGAQEAVRLELVGAGPGEVAGEDLLATRSNHLVGNDAAGWVTDIANYGSVLYRDVYDGIDIRYYGNNSALEYDFILAPGADASQLQLRFHGTDQVEVTQEGDLVLHVTGSDRELRFAAPVSYQSGPNGRESVESRYEVQADGSVRIVVGTYDPTRQLVVDPVLLHATYFGEGGAETAMDVAIGPDGSVYVTGNTTSSGGDFATRLAPGFDGNEIYVARFSADLGTLHWVTRVGGSGNEEGMSIAVDGSGNAVVTGWTKSTDFPMVSATQGSRDGTQDAVIFKLNSAGSALVFSTYFGAGGNTDKGTAVAVDAAGNVHAAGMVSSNTLLDPLLSPLLGGSDNAFLNKYSPTGTQLFHKQFGGTGDDGATDLALDPAGNIYMVGNTLSGDITMVNGAQTARGGVDEIFLVRYDSAGNVVYSTYVGDDKADRDPSLAVDAEGRAYVVGRTKDPLGSGFTTTAGAFSTTARAHEAGFLRIYDTDVGGAGSLVYSTFLGTSLNAGGVVSGLLTDTPTGVALVAGKVAIVGTTDASNLPVTADAITGTYPGATSGFVLVLNPAGGGAGDLVYGSYYGEWFTPGGVKASAGTLYVAGHTVTSGLATADGYRSAPTGGGDGLVAAIAGFNSAPVLTGTSNLPAQLEDAAAGSGVLVSSLFTAIDAESTVLGIAVTAVDSSNGSWQYALDGTTWKPLASPTAGSAFLLAADGSTRVRFLPATDYSGGSSITFHAWDRTTGAAEGTVSIASTGDSTAFSSASGTASVAITAVNDAPVLAAGAVNNLTVFEASGTTSLGLAGLAYSGGPASDEAGQALTYTVTAVPAATLGQIVLADDTTLVVPGAYTLDQMRGMQFRAASGVISGSGTFSFTVTDNGGVANGGTNALAQSIPVAIVNQAPTLTGANALNPVYEDFPVTGPSPTNPPAHVNPAQRAGTLVSDLLAGKVSDAGNVYGIAITGVDTTNGSWQYSTDGANTWNSLAASPGSALLLTNDGLTRVRFLPNANYAGTATLTFRAWDRTSGAAGSTANLADPTAVGGSSAFSAFEATTSVTVNAVNDAPVRTSGTLANLSVVEGTGTTSLGLAGLAYAAAPATATDEAGQTLSFTVGTVPAASFGTVLLADGVTVVAAGGSYSLADIQGMQFRAAAGAIPGTATFSFSVKDSGGRLDGGDDNLGQNLQLTITNVAPSLGGANAMPAILEDAVSGTGVLVADLLAGHATDVGNRLGIAVTAADSTNGLWEFTTNGGSTWSTLTGSATSARLLAADAQTRVRFTPAADWNGTASLAFHAWDQSTGIAGDLADTTNKGGAFAFSTASASTAVTVTPVNDAPKLAAGTVADLEVNEDSGTTSLGLGGVGYGPGGGSDEAAQSLSYTVTALPPATLGTIVLADGTVVTTGVYTLDDLRGMRFVTAANATGTGTFSYTVADDGGGATNALPQTIQITVHPVNDAPEASGASATGAEDATSITITPGGSDIDGTIAGVTLQTLPANGLLYIDAPLTTPAVAGTVYAGSSVTFHFVPAANFNGTASFTYTVTDNAGLANATAGTATITVTAVDDPTLVAADTSTVNEDAAASGNVLTNDSDVETALQVSSFVIGGVTYNAGDVATVTGVGTFTLAANGAYTFTPVANWNGTLPQVTYKTNTDATSTLDISVNAVDDATVVAADAVTVDEDTPATGNVLANDSDVETTLQVTSFVIGGLTYNAGDVATVTGVGTFTLAVNGAYTFTPAANWNGTAPQVTYKTNTDVTSTLDVTISAVNDPTVVVGDAVTVNEDTPATGNVLANDIDVETALQVTGFVIGGVTYNAGDIATITGVGTFTLAASGGYTFTPAANWNGTVPQVTYQVNTGVTSSLDITVTAADDATVVVADAATVDEDTPATGNVLANDSDVETALQVTGFLINGTSYTAGQTATLASIGSFTLASNGAYTFTPVAHWNGTLPQVTYSTNTGVTSTLDVTVNALNDPTVVVADAVTVDEDTPATGNVLANDSDVETVLQVTGFVMGGVSYNAGDTVTITGVGTFTLGANGAYAFTPAANWNGTLPQVTYSTNTGSTSTLDVTVTAVDDPTVVVNDSVTANEDTPVTGNVLANDSDAEMSLQVTGFQVNGTSYTAGQTAIVAGIGTFNLGANGAYAFTPAANWNGAVPQVSYTTNTGAAGTLDIELLAVNDPTVAVADTATAREDNVASGNVLANDSDVETVLQVTGFQVGGSSYTAGQTATLAGIGSFTLAADGSFSFSPAANWNGSAPQVSYTTNTGAGATLTIAITAANDVPVLVTGNLNLQFATDAPSAPLGLQYAAGGGADEAAQAITVRVTAVPAAGFGTLVLADGVTVVTVGGNYLLSELAGMRFVAAPGISGGPAVFGFDVIDSGGTANGGADRIAQQLTLQLRPNQAPVLTGTNVLPGILEDASGNAGMSVADLLLGHVSDADGGARSGIAVTSATSAGGTWQYSLDGGATWSAFGGVSESNARLLASDAATRVRFVPHADWNGVATGFVFRAWDQSAGSWQLSNADASANGAGTAFSAGTATASIVVSAVNDAPRPVTAAPVPVSVTTAGTPVSLGLGGIAYGPGGGADEAAQALLVTLDRLPPASAGTLLLADGTAVAPGVQYTLAQLQGMQFIAAAGSTDSVNLSWTVVDDGGSAAGGADRYVDSMQVAVNTPAPAPVAVAPPRPAPEPEVPAAPAPVVVAPPADAGSPAPAPAAAPRIVTAPAPAPAPISLAVEQRGRTTSTAEALLGGASSAVQTLLMEFSSPLERRLAAENFSLQSNGSSLLERRDVQPVGFLPGAADFQVTGFASFERLGTRLTVEEIGQTLRAGAFVDQLDRLREQLRQEFDLDRTVSISVAGLSLGVSVVYVLWLVRGGVLLGSYLSALPAWRLLDPLPVLSRVGDEEDEDDEPLANAGEAAPDPLRGFA